MSINDRIRQQITGWVTQNKPAMGDRELIALLRKHFDSLDVAPKDGVIHISEIRKAQAEPPADFTDKDLAMLDLLGRYYNILREFDDETEGADPGISKDDLDVFELCLSQTLTDHMLASLDAATEKDS